MGTADNDAYATPPCANTAAQAQRAAQLNRIKLRYLCEPLLIFIGIVLAFYGLGQLQAQDELAKQNDANASAAKQCSLNKNNINMQPNCSTKTNVLLKNK